ncbi:ABC transporter ATP-binding protein [candidate division KSB1 bacterium]|nr:MAG: ABC transporter ATP-binding protein [candidate division KSB1 bacterium]
MKSLLFLKKYLTRYKKRLVFGVCFVFLTNAVSILAPRLLGYIIDSLKIGISGKRLAFLSGVFLLIAIVQGVFRFLMRQLMMGLSRRIEYDLRNDFFAHLQTLSQSYYNITRTGDLMARATNDLNAIRGVLGHGIMYLLNTVFLFTLAIILMININLKLTLFSLIPFPFLVLSINRFGYLIHKRFEKIQEQFSKISSRAQENLSGIRLIKAYVREKSEIDEFKKLNREYVDRNKSLIKVWSLFFPGMKLLGGIAIVIVLWYGGSKVISGEITLGEFVAFMSYLMMLVWPMVALGWVLNIFQRGSASMKRFKSILDVKPDIKDDNNTDYSIKNIYGEIEFRNLYFSYNDTVVLKNINLKIKKGMTLGIIGPTGSGKTTLVSLIPRLFDCKDNTLFIDGVNIKKIPLKVLRGSIGFVPQETFLFSETIKENIGYSLDQMNENMVKEAAKVSRVSKDIEEFPQKYETLLGERGINLSGGQKQRTAISRAIIKNPKILILDDALSSVDTKTEEEILENLKDFLKTRTCIIVSHRISTIKNSDLIIVLDNGEIVERGTHSELIKKDGLYASIHKKQLLTRELEKL